LVLYIANTIHLLLKLESVIAAKAMESKEEIQKEYSRAVLQLSKATSLSSIKLSTPSFNATPQHHHHLLLQVHYTSS